MIEFTLTLPPWRLRRLTTLFTHVILTNTLVCIYNRVLVLFRLCRDRHTLNSVSQNKWRNQYEQFKQPRPPANWSWNVFSKRKNPVKRIIFFFETWGNDGFGSNRFKTPYPRTTMDGYSEWRTQLGTILHVVAITIRSPLTPYPSERGSTLRGARSSTSLRSLSHDKTGLGLGLSARTGLGLGGSKVAGELEKYHLRTS